ncbi:MAG: hypothetical protein LBS19_16635 [Clostridiales bacterium]|nr:hypothetical protein [Clostridiales bacterium]
MSVPTFPDKPEGYTIEDSISQILTSIAMEEIGLSHIINSEGEKLQYVMGTLPGAPPATTAISDILNVNESVKEMLEAVSTSQMFLYGKMTSALNAYYKGLGKPGQNGGGQTGPDQPVKPITDIPAIAEGRILAPDKSGDKTDWVEIARNGDYSLIVRSGYINTDTQLPTQGNPSYQFTAFGTTNNYNTSNVRRKINDWFMGTADASAEVLPENARLRSFTVRSDAPAALGTGAASAAGKDDGFSKPSAIKDPRGSDVAFALSYGEAASFASKAYAWGGGADSQNSVQAAADNFAKLGIPTDDTNKYNRLWLRSPGSTSDMASSLSQSGLVFQTPANDTEQCGLLYPALWVQSDVFN